MRLLTHLQVIPDEALLELCRLWMMDAVVPATKDLKAHIHAGSLLEHPGVLVANSRSVRGEKTYTTRIKCLRGLCDVEKFYCYTSFFHLLFDIILQKLTVA